MLLEKLHGIENRYQELTQLLAQPDIISDREKFVKFNKEHAELMPILFAFEAYKKICKEMIYHEQHHHFIVD